MYRFSRFPGLLVAAEGLLIFIPLIVLGAAINWPASLDDPAATALPRLLANEGAVRVGYLVYLAYSVLFLPVAVLITRWLRPGEAASPVVLIALGLATASSVLRCIGIARWLTTMLPLTQRWETGTEPERVAMTQVFESVNDYGGALGELLGVSLFAAAWLIVTLLGNEAGAVPRWVQLSGALVAAALALPLLELAGMDTGALVSVSSAAMTLWLVAVGVTMAVKPSVPQPIAP